MKALLIDPETQQIETTEVNDMDDVRRLVGYDTLESDAVGTGGDRLFFDEECFIRGTTGRFQIDTLVPVAGRGVVVGVSADGEGLADAQVSAAALAERTRFH